MNHHADSRIRTKLQTRDGGVCARCGAAGVDWDADHIVPVAEGGSHELDNYQTLCRRICHRIKTADQAADAAFRREWRDAVASGKRQQLDLLMDTDPLAE